MKNQNLSNDFYSKLIIIIIIVFILCLCSSNDRENFNNQNNCYNLNKNNVLNASYAQCYNSGDCTVMLNTDGTPFCTTRDYSDLN